VEDLVAAADGNGDDGFPAGARAKVRAAADYLRRAPGVVRVVCDVPLPSYDDRLPAAPRDPDRLVALSDRWALDSALNRLLAALAQATAE
jgi:hypothetical protein